MDIKLENLTFTYMQGTPFERRALDDVSLYIQSGAFVGLIGHTGSGKSTLVQHLNGLLKPSSGRVFIGGKDITVKGYNMRQLRFKVGLVFQYPEHQLFDETVFEDIAFGPKNMGLNENEVKLRVEEAAEMVGITSDLLIKSPFELSGGQKRRAAIAGVLAMKPEILILDEPAAGLDPKGRDEILFKIRELHDKNKMTVILVSHSMEDIARVSTEAIVMNKAQIAMQGSISEVFRRSRELEAMHLGVPQITLLANRLRELGYPLSEDIFTVKRAREEIFRLVEGIK